MDPRKTLMLVQTPINIKFSNLSYDVMESKSSSKIILNRVSGEFCAGELSAIMGHSGSGKTTLLNVLSGYRIHQTHGYIEVNNEKLVQNAFRKMRRYISQVDHIDPYFTTLESLMLASQFKYATYTVEERSAKINELLETLKLRKQANTLISNLSGGERKRLSVAMELLGDPAILFLDEPTTGLDEFSALQCIGYLKQLATRSGRTVIFSIHSPSARQLSMFDKIYALAQGQCVYQGSAGSIVPYLKNIELECPLSYNPGDFLIEVATEEYGNYQKQLVNQIQNGKIYKWLPNRDDKHESSQKDNSNQLSHNFATIVIQENSYDVAQSSDNNYLWWMEFNWNLIRILKRLWRDKMNLQLRIIADILISILVGLAYMNTGNNAKVGYSNYFFCLGTMMKCIFISMTPMVAYMSQQMPYLRREHFNRWYRLSSYFMALLTSQFLINFLMTAICSALMYFLANQPIEFFRLLLFFGITFLSTMMGSSYGIMIGSAFSSLNALFVGPAFMAVWMLCAIYPTGRTTLSLAETIMVYSSGIRYSVEGQMASLLAFDRSDLSCASEEIFCFFSKPKQILKFSGYNDISYGRAVAGLSGFYCLFALTAFMVIQSRLNRSNFMKYCQFRYLKYACTNNAFEYITTISFLSKTVRIRFKTEGPNL